MNNHRELSIDELDTVSGGDFGGLESIVQLESVRLEGASQTPVSPTPPALPGHTDSKASKWAAGLKAKIAPR